jgi:hypothetical protein
MTNSRSLSSFSSTLLRSESHDLNPPEPLYFRPNHRTLGFDEDRNVHVKQRLIKIITNQADILLSKKIKWGVLYCEIPELAVVCKLRMFLNDEEPVICDVEWVVMGDEVVGERLE